MSKSAKLSDHDQVTAHIQKLDPVIWKGNRNFKANNIKCRQTNQRTD